METKRPHNLAEQISAYLDGELSEAERAEVQERLESDPDARRLMAELRQVCHLVGSLPREHAPPEIMELVTAQIERHELLKDGPQAGYGVPRRRPRWGRIVASAAVIAMAASAGYLTFVSFRNPAATRTEERFGPVADAHRATPPEAPAERTGPKAAVKHKGPGYRDAEEPPAARPSPAGRSPQGPSQAVRVFEPPVAARMDEHVPKAPMTTAPAVEIVRAGRSGRVESEAGRRLPEVLAAKADGLAEGPNVQEAVTAVPPAAMADTPTERRTADVAPEQPVAAGSEEPADRLEIELAFGDVASRARAGREIVQLLNSLAGSVVARSDLPYGQAAKRLTPGAPARELVASQPERTSREPECEPGRDFAGERIVAHVAAASLPGVIARIERAAQRARTVHATAGRRVVTDWEQVRILADGYGRYATPPLPGDSPACTSLGRAAAGLPESQTEAAVATRTGGWRAKPLPSARSTVEAEAARREREDHRARAVTGMPLEGELGAKPLGELPKNTRTEVPLPMSQPCLSVAQADPDGSDAKTGKRKGGVTEWRFDRAAAGRPASGPTGTGRVPDRSPEPEITPAEDASLRLRVVLVVSPAPDGHPASAPLSGQRDRRLPATRPGP